MALRVPCPDTGAISLGEFIEYVESSVDRKDAASIASAAPKLRALANDRQLVLTALHRQMGEAFSQRRVATSQVVVLGGSSDFYVRADVWPTAEAAQAPLYREQADLYRYGISQNFPCLMTGYHGPGLIHDLYACRLETVAGYAGEPLELQFVERLRLTTDSAILFLPQGEVVQRIAPEAFSISIGLMIMHESGEQHYVDVQRRTLAEFSPLLPSSRRMALLRLAGLIGDEQTQRHLDDISRSSPCPRTRLAAYEALTALAPAEGARLWVRAADDPAAILQRQARHKLAASGRRLGG